MENASKALIIAGAILLSILIIGFGMAIYNNSSATKGAADLSGEQVAAHNQSFRAYNGKINGTQVKALLAKISNNNNEQKDKIINVSFSTNGTAKALTEFNITADDTKESHNWNGANKTSLSQDDIKKDVLDNTTYRVEFTESQKTGYINGCKIYVATLIGNQTSTQTTQP